MKWSDVHWMFLGMGLYAWLLGVVGREPYLIVTGGILSLVNGYAAVYSQRREQKR